MPAYANQNVGLTHPKHGARVHVSKGDRRSEDDPIVREYPWAFDIPNVEQATAAPGEKRTLSYECDECEFTTHSRRGLKSHKTQSHD